MKKHYVYFYGGSKIICGCNSLSPESMRNRNQLIGLDGIFDNANYHNQEFIECAEKCLNQHETGVLPNLNISIVPFQYLYNESGSIRFLEDVILANEQYIFADEIYFPLTELKFATQEGYSLLINKKISSFSVFEQESVKKLVQHCCYGHYYLHLLKISLNNKGYYSSNMKIPTECSELRGELFTHKNGFQVKIFAEVGGL